MADTKIAKLIEAMGLISKDKQGLQEIMTPLNKLKTLEGEEAAFVFGVWFEINAKNNMLTNNADDYAKAYGKNFEPGDSLSLKQKKT